MSCSLPAVREALGRENQTIWPSPSNNVPDQTPSSLLLICIMPKTALPRMTTDHQIGVVPGSLVLCFLEVVFPVDHWATEVLWAGRAFVPVDLAHWPWERCKVAAQLPGECPGSPGS